MAKHTLDEVTAALAATVQPVTGIGCHVRPPRNVNPPVTFPGTRSGKIETSDGYDVAGSQSVTIPLWTVVAATDGSQFVSIDQVISGEKSIEAALDATPDLGLGEGVDAAVDGEWSEGEIDLAGTTYWGVRVDVEVIY